MSRDLILITGVVGAFVLIIAVIVLDAFLARREQRNALALRRQMVAAKKERGDAMIAADTGLVNHQGRLDSLAGHRQAQLDSRRLK